MMSLGAAWGEEGKEAGDEVEGAAFALGVGGRRKLFLGNGTVEKARGTEARIVSRCQDMAWGGEGGSRTVAKVVVEKGFGLL